MNFWRRFLWALSLLAASMAMERSSAAADTWRAGAAKTLITPDKFMWMMGYASRNHPADGKISDLWAKALALEDPAGRRAVLVTLDLCGIDRGLSQSVCRKLEAKHGLTRDQIALCVSHTHSGPVVAGCLKTMRIVALDDEQNKLADEYAAVLETKIVTVVGEALAQLAPAKLSWGSGTATVAVNRRTNLEPDVPKLRAAGQLKGPVDHDVPVLAVKDAGGKLTAVVFGYACHATVLSLNQWCADWPGFAQTELEKSHLDCVALFWAGCGADQNPLPRRTVELAEQYGRQIAAAVNAVLAKEMQDVGGGLQTSYRETPLAFDKLPTREQLQADLQDKNAYVAARAKLLLSDIDAGKPLQPAYPYPVGVWRIGNDVQFVILGGDVVVDFALRLKAELGGPKTWVAGYSNDVMAYIPSRRVLIEGGYEGGGAMVYYALPTIWTPDVEQTIVDEVYKQVRERK